MQKRLSLERNVLLYAHDDQSPCFAKTNAWLRRALADVEAVGITSTVALGFIRLACNPHVVDKPLHYKEACKIVKSWYDAGAVLVEPTPEMIERAGELISQAQGGANLIMDAYLAALAVATNSTLYSTDGDFLRFPGLRVANPAL